MNRNIFFLSLFLNLTCSSLCIHAQIRPSIHFTEDDGLPGNTVRDILRDKSGIIWIATDNGIANYDGDKFHPVYNKGLPLQMSWALACGEENEIYVGLYTEGLAIIKNDSIIRIIHSTANYPLGIRKLYYSNYFKKLFIGTNYGLFVLRDTTLIPVTYSKENGIKSVVLSISGRDSTICFSVSDEGIYKLYLKQDEPDKWFAERISNDGSYACLVSGDTIYGGYFNNICRIEVKNSSKVYHRSKAEPSLFIWNFSSYRDGEFLIGGFGDDRFRGDVVVFNPQKNISRPLNIKQNIQSVNSIFYDTISKVIWIARDNGMTAVFESPFEYYDSNNSGPISDIGLAGDSLMVLTQSGVNYLKDGKMLSVLSKEKIMSKINFWFNKIYPTLGNKPYVFDNSEFNELVSFVQNGKKLFLSTQKGALSVSDMKTYLPFAVGTFRLVTNNSAYSFVKYTPLKFFSSFKDSLKWMIPDGPGGNVLDINKIIESDNVYYCISSLRGLYAIKNNIVFRLSEENSTIDNYLIDFDKGDDGKKWCLSANGKLFEIGFSDSLFIKRKIDLLRSGLIGNNCKWFKFKGKYLLIGTNKGLNVINNARLSSEQPTIQHFYNSFNGYDFISAGSPVSNGKDKVYLHTVNEIIAVDTNYISSGKVKIIIKNILINGKEAS